LTTTGSSRRKLVCARSFVGLAVAAQEGDSFLLRSPPRGSSRLLTLLLPTLGLLGELRRAHREKMLPPNPIDRAPTFDILHGSARGCKSAGLCSDPFFVFAKVRLTSYRVSLCQIFSP
jgi:hypothetical protein